MARPCLFVVGCCLLVAAACASGPPPPVESREAVVLAERAAKDRMFRSDKQSPLLPEQKATFAGLPYYPFDPAYRVPASLTPDPAAGDTIIQLPTSAQEMRRMRRIGTLTFTIAGQSLALTAFADADTRSIDQLFVPFGDATSGTETYGGGRYLELPRTPTGLYDLDFNLAYHPYCVFNPSYVCPVPPRENRLAIPIPAGEKLR
jgi:uncharacterized protein (DUF1684 family)